MQISMFDGKKKFVLDKPIRLIELFAGYGSQALALKYLGVKFEHWKICEWAVKSIQAYKDAHFTNDNNDYSASLSKEEIFNFLDNRGISQDYNTPMTRQQIERLGEIKTRQIYNNIIANHNLVNIQQTHAKDLEIVDTDKYCYVMTYSFPCQDLSLAGKQAGMGKDSGTRSGLLWEVERILDECQNLPQVLLMENVPEVIGANNIKHFSNWLKKLESLGYKCYWKVLNAKEYGVPQNRERCFMISILGDYYYNFPNGFKLEHRLKDLLEDNVDEHFYLSDSMKKYISANNNKWTGNNDKAVINRDIGVTINTRVGQTRTDCSDYLCEDLPENYDLKQVGQIYGFGKEKNPQAGRVYDADGLSPTLDTCTGGNRMPKIVDKLKNIKEPLICASRGRNVGGCEKTQQQIEINPSGCSNTLTSVQKDNYVIEPQQRKDNLKTKMCNELIEQGKVKEYDVLRHNYTTSKNGNCVQANNESPTLDTRCDCLGVVKDLRIRKLTPKECFRLMGVKDEDFEKIAKNQSNASLYHLAGDSIVVDVLMAIFKEIK